MSDASSTEISNWSEKRRTAAWAKASADRSNYARAEGRIKYIGPVPRACLCGEYHAPGETCAIGGTAFTPQLRGPARG